MPRNTAASASTCRRACDTAFDRQRTVLGARLCCHFPFKGSGLSQHFSDYCLIQLYGLQSAAGATMLGSMRHKVLHTTAHRAGAQSMRHTYPPICNSAMIIASANYMTSDTAQWCSSHSQFGRKIQKLVFALSSLRGGFYDRPCRFHQDIA